MRQAGREEPPPVEAVFTARCAADGQSTSSGDQGADPRAALEPVHSRNEKKGETPADACRVRGALRARRARKATEGGRLRFGAAGRCAAYHCNAPPPHPSTGRRMQARTAAAARSLRFAETPPPPPRSRGEGPAACADRLWLRCASSQSTSSPCNVSSAWIAVVLLFAGRPGVGGTGIRRWWPLGAAGLGGQDRGDRKLAVSQDRARSRCCARSRRVAGAGRRRPARRDRRAGKVAGRRSPARAVGEAPANVEDDRHQQTDPR